MGVTSSLKKCPKCNAFSTNSDVCEHCGELLSYKKKQKLREQKMLEDQVTLLKERIENPNFVERMKLHKFFLIRIFGYLLYTTSVVISVIVAGLTWVITMVLAG